MRVVDEELDNLRGVISKKLRGSLAEFFFLK
jgi:hypothetical protein